MARIELLDSELYRVRITREYPDGSLLTTAFGPYATERAARSRITHERNRDIGHFIKSAHVDRIVGDWREVAEA